MSANVHDPIGQNATALRIQLSNLTAGSPEWHRINDLLCRLLRAKR